MSMFQASLRGLLFHRSAGNLSALRTACRASSSHAASENLPATFVPGFHDESTVRCMPYSAFGKAGWQVSRLSFGTSSFGSVYYPVKQEDCNRVTELAIRSGINYLDSAPWYGHGEAEKRLGVALKGIPRQAYYLTTKVGRYEQDVLQQFDFSFKRTKQSVEESLQRLQVDCIDTMQVHDPEFAPSLEVVLEETLPALQEAQKQGKIKHIGITGYPLDMLLELADGARQRGIPLHSAISYCHYNLSTTKLLDSGVLQKLQGEHGLGVVNASVFAMGLLSSRGPPAWHPAEDSLRHLCDRARALAAQKGVDFTRLVLAFALQSSSIPTHMISTTASAELASALAVATGTQPLSSAEREVLHMLRKELFEPEARKAAESSSSPASKDAVPLSWEGREVGKYWAKWGKAKALQLWQRERSSSSSSSGAAMQSP